MWQSHQQDKANLILLVAPLVRSFFPKLKVLIPVWLKRVPVFQQSNDQAAIASGMEQKVFGGLGLVVKDFIASQTEGLK